MLAYVVYTQTPLGLRLEECLYKWEDIDKEHYRCTYNDPRVKYQSVDFSADDVLMELINSFSLEGWRNIVFHMIETKHPAIFFGEMCDFPKEIIIE
jgi:alpha-amylase/alpha-mannosidase (GH57 family)